MLISVFLLFRKMTTHWYFIRANKKRIISDFEQENAATRDALAQLQGQMGTILEHLQARRDINAVVNQVDAAMVSTAVDTTLVVMDPIEPVVQPATISKTQSQAGPGRFVASYPWGIPHTYNPQFSTGNPFTPY